MKKIILTFALILTFAISAPTADAFTSKYANFWAELFGHKFDNQNPAKKSYSRRTIKRRPVSRLSNRRSLFSRRFKQRRFLIRRTTNIPGLVATISPTSPNQSIYKVDENPINIFKIGIRNDGKTSYTKFPATILLDKAEFQLFSKNGIFDDARDFDLVVNGESFSFDADGKATIRFNNARLAEGESLELNIAIKAATLLKSIARNIKKMCGTNQCNGTGSLKRII